MKILGVSIFLILAIAGNSIAQKPALPFDERGKYIYYEVVNQNGNASALASRAEQFFKAYAKSVVLKSVAGDTAYKADGKFIVSKTASALSHPSGEVKYKLSVEIKAGKYRYWLTDFVFIPYQRDRYGNFVAGTVYGTPLEKAPGKLNKGEWESYIAVTAEQAKALGIKLKKRLSEEAQPKTVEKPVSTGKW